MANVSGSGIRTCISQKNNNNETMWRKPILGEVKCNMDAANFKDQRCYGVGMCLRDLNGEYIAAKITWFQGIPQPQEAEACGLKEAIIWFRNRGLMVVSI